MNATAIVDTNVVIAGLLTAHVDSSVARILDGMLVARFPFVLSEPLLAEYHAVLGRGKLRKLHGLADEEIDTLLVALAECASFAAPVATEAAPDPGDQHLWELLAACPRALLVTGDKRLFGPHGYAKHVISPAAFVESWETQG